MDPISIGLQAVGMGMKLYGAFSGASDSSKYAEEMNRQEQQKFGLEKAVNQQRQQAMELSGRRQQLEIFRNTQRARAMGLNASVNQGAQFGSGMPGGQASAQNQGFFNAAGVNRNLEVGRNIFGLDSQITDINATESTLKANYQSSQAKSQAWSSLGGSIMGAAGGIGNIAGAAGGTFDKMAGLFSGGSLSGGFGTT